ncbi:gamma-interferon-responsive lysosomal thiol protein isoform X2 [Manihot esculenta]|uniref:Gamma-interferon-inducible lysosomal thiol reductase n=1 Tax=Manihot esculenta TaxID=3983 RepID=A0A2C9VEW0_MANES|nr:gamma-interferon-responsive lysosomal thiol protein isoform X2 [Manihot esculenta]
MASLCPLFAFFLLVCISSPSISQKVTLSLYYETLCPYCADFIVNHLVKVFDGGLTSIVDLRMIPWGNAFIQSDGTFVCQERHFSFIYCMESLALQNRLNEWVNCFETARFGKEPIDCYTSGYGNVLEQKFAAETAQLNPPHRFVPWVLVNNQPIQEDFKNFVSYVCNAYQGTQVPETCKSLPTESNSFQKEIPTSPVCSANKTGNFISSSRAINKSPVINP